MAMQQDQDYVPEVNEPSLGDMIKKLYDGNFTTGELERQLIAEIFMKMLDEMPESDDLIPE